MPHSSASDLGLHCLPMSNKKDAKQIWGKKNYRLVTNLITQNICLSLKKTYYCDLLRTFSNNIDPKQAGQNFMPDLDSLV